MEGWVDLKEEFINRLSQILTQKGFKKSDESFTKYINQQLPGQVVMINGQRMESPGKIIKLSYTVDIVGDGWIADTDESNKVDFTEVRFQVQQDQEIMIDMTECVYWTDYEYINILIDKIFTL